MTHPAFTLIQSGFSQSGDLVFDPCSKEFNETKHIHNPVGPDGFYPFVLRPVQSCPPASVAPVPADEWQPLEPDDVPPGTVVGWGADEGWHMVNCVLSEYIFVPSGRDKQWWCFGEMFRRDDFLIKRPREDWTRARKAGAAQKEGRIG